MPTRPLTPCSFPGCGKPVRGRRCDKHRSHRTNQTKLSAHARGYGKRWQRARLEHLREHPLCANCLKSGIIKEAKDVDHVIPHNGDMDAFWDRSNWQSLCVPCHRAKSAREQRISAWARGEMRA